MIGPGALPVYAADDSHYLGALFNGYPNPVVDADIQAFVDATDPLEHRVRRMPNKAQSPPSAAGIRVHGFALKRQRDLAAFPSAASFK